MRIKQPLVEVPDGIYIMACWNWNYFFNRRMMNPPPLHKAVGMAGELPNRGGIKVCPHAARIFIIFADPNNMNLIHAYALQKGYLESSVEAS